MYKCPSCKYEKRTIVDTIDKPVYFKSGPRKGQLKEITREKVVHYPDDPDFIELVFEKEVDEIGYKNRDSGSFGPEFKPVDLIGCPECGTVFIGEINTVRFHR